VENQNLVGQRVVITDESIGVS